MRILNTTVLLSPIIGGGTAERTFQMSKTFVRKGCECTIVTTNIGLNDERINRLENVQLLALRCIFTRFFVVTFSIKKIKHLVSNVDVIHMMGHWNMINVLIYLITRLTKTPYVICPAGELNIFGRSVLIKKFFNVLIGRKIISDASGYIAITNDEAHLFKKYNVDSNKIIVIPNGVNQEDFISDEADIQVKKINTGGQPYILFMGRLNLIKGPDLLLNAFLKIHQKYPEHHLVFAGPDGGMRDHLEKLTNQSAVSNRIHFVGYVNGLDKITAYSNADLLVIPSRHEAMSIVVLESGMAKTPVLITDQCGFNIIYQQSAGFVVEANACSIEEGLCFALSDKEKLKRMGENLHQYVLENYTWDIIGERYISFFQTVITNQKNLSAK